MFRNRRRYVTRLTMLVLTLTSLIILIWPDTTLINGKVSAQTPAPTPSPTPWQSDPMGNPGNYTLFRNDNLFIAGQVAYGPKCQGDKQGGYSNQKFTAKPGPTLDGNGFDAADINNVSPTGHLVDYRYAGGSGRILKQDSEQGVIYKLLNYSDSGQAAYYVNVFDSSGTRWEYTFPAVSASTVSHLDVAVGDLDRQRNTSGEYQDEVVLVSESGRATMQVTLISFKDFDQKVAPQITTLDTGIAVGYYIDRTIGSNYNRGGQVSVAAGDFDGDGKMEVAATTVSSGGDIWLSVFRYTNDGKIDPQLTMTDHQRLSNTYQYSDIAAGDFNGSGHDQVVISAINQGSRSVYVEGYEINSALKILPQSVLHSQALGSANNGINGNPSDGITNLSDTINSEGWVQLKAGLFKYDPFNGYGVRKRQLGIMFGNARPAVGILELPANSTTLQWLPGANLRNLDDFSGSAYGIWRQGPSLGGVVPDVREAYTLMAGNFGGKDSQNPAWQLAAVAPYKTTTNAYVNQCTSYASEFELGYAIAAWQYTHGEGTTASPYSFSFQNLAVPVSINGKWNWRTQGGRNIAAVALDLDGNSLHLGAPVKITVQNLFTPDAVLQEPPKHLDWIPGKPDLGGRDNFFNVSRYKEFKLLYTLDQSSETTNEVKTTASVAIGRSTTTTAEESISLGIPHILDVDLDAEQKFESESDFKSEVENSTKNTQGVEFKYTSAAEQADSVVSRTRTLVVFRYRLYGAKPAPDTPTVENASVFYDLVFPVETSTVTSPGDTSEGYQPLHENGNLLTYPYLPSFDKSGGPSAEYGFYRGQQLGTCSVTKTRQCGDNSDCPSNEACAGNGNPFGPLPGLLANPNQNTWGSNAQPEYEIKFTQSGTTGTSILTEQKLKSSQEFKFGFKAKAELPFEGVEGGGSIGGSLEYSTSNASSWSNATISESSTSMSRGFKIEQPSITADAYQYKTWAYVTQGGYLKVAHAANILGTNVSSRFAEIYGKTYDLALNLPQKFLPDESVTSQPGRFLFNTGIERKETKSIFITDPSVPGPDGLPTYISGAIDAEPELQPGKKLLVNVRVYNLSTAKSIVPQENLVARFELVPWNSLNNEEGERQGLNDPDHKGVVTEVPIPAVAPYGTDCPTTDSNYPICNSAVISAEWDTTGWGPGQYRLYVVLDYYNALPDEFHEWQDRYNDPVLQVNPDPDPGKPVDENREIGGRKVTLEKGQNNEGWMYVSIAAPSVTASRIEQTPELRLADDAVSATGFYGRHNSQRIRTVINTPLRVRIKVHSDAQNTGNHHVLFYDQDPEKGGQSFASRLLRGITKGDNYVWTTYTPRHLGQQRIWARVVEHADDPQPGNHTDSLVINVRPADKRPPQLLLSLTPNQLLPPNNQMVEVVATILAEDNQDPEPQVRLEAITHNEANSSAGDVEGAEFGTDDRQFSLRAARSGRRREERVYEVVYSVTDRSGNKTFAKAYVTVPQRR